ncbi:MAG: class I SAM-dependent methyltransferase [Azoarcus sp.]|jgi:SAM-dependent methyltransferase|nr:class I SAM-dependent methyltransferase [Azoarcus sp.]
MNNENNTPERLALRIQSNARGDRDLEEFIIEMANPDENDDVLEIGCGSGKQMRIVAPMVHSMLCIDISQDLIDLIQESGTPENVRLMRLNMDESPKALTGKYSLIYSVYALYYSRDVNALINDLTRKILAADGRFLCVAPDEENNRQWFEDLASMFVIPEEISRSPFVSRGAILPAMLNTFRSTSCHRFENTLTFNRTDDLMKYYDGCAYCPGEKRTQAEKFFARKIASDGVYKIRKHALGMLGRC